MNILKLPIGTIAHSGRDLSDSVENEWLCHLILSEYVFPIATAEMVNDIGRKAIAQVGKNKKLSSSAVEAERF